MMRNVRHDQFVTLPIAFSLTPALPPGIGQRDCDGRATALDDTGGSVLWGLCDADEQEAIAARFIDSHAETLRDAILDLQDAAMNARASPPKAPATSLGSVIWSSWIVFRDRALRDMLGIGQFAGP
jgi:hypothetical protein